MPQLTEDEYKATMAYPMRRMGRAEAPSLNLGPYVDAIPVGDLGEYDFSSRTIPHVYATPDGRFVHVLLAASVPDVFLVIVIHAASGQVRGHHLLDLASVYGTGDKDEIGSPARDRID